MGGIGLEHHRSSEDGAARGLLHRLGRTPSRDVTCSRTSTRTRGTASSAGRRISGRRTSTCRCATACCGSTRDRRSTGVTCWRRAQVCGPNSRRVDAIANVAATYDHRVGRTWRHDGGHDQRSHHRHRRPQSWRSWQRSEDYYSEGQLIWLDADTLIRELSHGTKSLDDFARTFFGVDNGSYVTRTYTFDDVVQALNAVQPYDWATFLKTRLQSHGPGAPLDGLTRGGYRLIYTDTPSQFSRVSDERRHTVDLTYSIGATIARDGVLADVLWDGPAFKAGLTEGARIVAVNGTAYSADRIEGAIRAAKGTTAPIELAIQNGERYFTVRIDDHDGLRYPHLERVPGTPDQLGEILTPRQ